MNLIKLKGIIKDTQFSHSTNGINYCLSHLVVPGNNGKENNITLKYKELCNHYKDDTEISLIGNIRSHTTSSGIEVSIFTYFDLPKEEGAINDFLVSGKICEIGDTLKTKSGKSRKYFLLHNTISSSQNKKIESYLPCYLWGNDIGLISNKKIGDEVIISGELHSRDSLKNGKIKVYHNLIVKGMATNDQELH